MMCRVEYNHVNLRCGTETKSVVRMETKTMNRKIISTLHILQYNSQDKVNSRKGDMANQCTKCKVSILRDILGEG